MEELAFKLLITVYVAVDRTVFLAKLGTHKRHIGQQ